MPGQALGFSLQYTKMAALLAGLDDNEATVEYEGLDDLTVRYSTGKVELWQLKSALASNPQADRSVELWKALANWSAILENKTLDYVKNEVFFYFCVTNEVKKGNIAQAFDDAKTDQEISSSLEAAKNILLQAGQDVTTVSTIFLNSPLAIQKYIIRNFSLEISSQGVYQEMNQFVKFFADSRHEDILDHAFGWVKRKVDSLIIKKAPAIILVKDFISEMRAYVRKYAERNVLKSVAPQIIDANEQKKLEQFFLLNS